MMDSGKGGLESGQEFLDGEALLFHGVTMTERHGVLLTG
jgi:hypothetical protein